MPLASKSPLTLLNADYASIIAHPRRLDLGIALISLLTVPSAAVGSFLLSQYSVPSQSINNYAIFAWTAPGPILSLLFSCTCLYRSRQRSRLLGSDEHASLWPYDIPHAFQPFPMMLASLSISGFLIIETGLTIASVAGGIGSLNQEDTGRKGHSLWMAGRALLCITVVLLFALLCMYLIHTTRAFLLHREHRLEARHAWTSISPQASPHLDDAHTTYIGSGHVRSLSRSNTKYSRISGSEAGSSTNHSRLSGSTSSKYSRFSDDSTSSASRTAGQYKSVPYTSTFSKSNSQTTNEAFNAFKESRRRSDESVPLAEGRSGMPVRTLSYPPPSLHSHSSAANSNLATSTSPPQQGLPSHASSSSPSDSPRQKTSPWPLLSQSPSQSAPSSAEAPPSQISQPPRQSTQSSRPSLTHKRQRTRSGNLRRQTLLREYYSVNRESLNRVSEVYPSSPSPYSAPIYSRAPHSFLGGAGSPSSSHDSSRGRRYDGEEVHGLGLRGEGSEDGLSRQGKER